MEEKISESESTNAVIPPTPPLLNPGVGGSVDRRPISVLVISLLLLLLSLYFIIGTGAVLVSMASFPLRIFHLHWWEVGIVVMFLASLTLLVSVIGLLCKRKWARHSTVVVSIIEAIICYGFISKGFVSPAFSLVFVFGFFICLGIGLLPLIVLTRPAVRAYFHKSNELMN